MESFYQALNTFGYTHPLHPTLVYLPIGCVMAAFIFGITAVLFNRTSLLTSAKHCVSLALVAVFPTIFLGYMDWQYFHGGSWIFPIRMKMVLAGVLIVLLAITFVYNLKSGTSRKTILALYALCFINVISIGYYGGEIVFGGHGHADRYVASTDHDGEVAPDSHGHEDRDSETAAREKGARPHAVITYTDVADIFHRNCIMCHKGSGAPYNVQLDTYEHVMEGGLEGKVIVPGDPDKSEIIRRIRGLSRPAMPFRREPLSEDKIETLVRWIEQGAKDAQVAQP